MPLSRGGAPYLKVGMDGAPFGKITVKANGTVPRRAPITLVCALPHPDTPGHFCPRGA